MILEELKGARRRFFVVVQRHFFCYHSTVSVEKKCMSFRRWHKKIYAFWVVISVLVVVSMIGFLFAPFFMY